VTGGFPKKEIKILLAASFMDGMKSSIAFANHF